MQDPLVGLKYLDQFTEDTKWWLQIMCRYSDSLIKVFLVN